MHAQHGRVRLAGSVVVVVVLLALAGSITASQEPRAPLTSAERGEGWVSLFDGGTLDAWRGYKRTDTSGTRWVVADGLLCAGPGAGRPTDILTKARYGPFDLRWEWRVEEGGNSGLKYFVLEDHDSAIGHEYQLIDDERHADARRGPSRQTAALYDVLGAANRPVRPAGEWNQSRIVVSGTTVEHFLNGVKVLEYELGSAALKAAIATSKFAAVARFGTPQRAHILLQDHGEAVCFRNIAVREAR